jgi:hypothetical protein
MKTTTARIRFKQHFGQANHHMITSLIGLHQLNESDIVNAPEELHTTWSPLSKVASIARARIFILQSFLGWAVDSIDMYVSLLNRKPNYIRDEGLRNQLCGAGLSVYKKVFAIGEFYQVQHQTLALIDVLITWRNNVFHELGDNTLKESSKEFLRNSEASFQALYCNLSPRDLPEKAEKGAPLTFKETASLISAVHNFVKEVDEKVISKINFIDFCKEQIDAEINGSNRNDDFTTKYYNLQGIERFRFIKNWLQNKCGISELPNEQLDALATIERVYFEKKKK